MTEEQIGHSIWQLDRQIAPVAVIIGLMLNFGALVWTASQFEARLTAIEHQQTVTTQEIRDLNMAREKTALDVAHLSDGVDRILAVVSRLEALSDKRTILPLETPQPPTIPENK